MHTHEIHLADAQDAVGEARECLFAFPEVLDVLATSRPDSLVVVFAGRPRPAEWSARLRAPGLRVVRATARRNPESLPQKRAAGPPSPPGGQHGRVGLAAQATQARLRLTGARSLPLTTGPRTIAGHYGAGEAS
jgi:hypothetical protein